MHHLCQVDRKIGLLIIPHDKWKLGKDYLVSSPAEMGGSRRIPAISSSFLVLLVGWLAAGWPIKVRMLIRPSRCVAVIIIIIVVLRGPEIFLGLS